MPKYKITIIADNDSPDVINLHDNSDKTKYSGLNEILVTKKGINSIHVELIEDEPDGD